MAVAEVGLLEGILLVEADMANRNSMKSPLKYPAINNIYIISLA